MSASRNSIESPAPGPATLASPAPPARRAAGDVVGQVVARGLNALLGVGGTIVLVRELGPSRYGAWSALLAVIAIVGYLTSLGVEEVAVRQAALERSWSRSRAPEMTPLGSRGLCSRSRACSRRSARSARCSSCASATAGRRA